MPGRESVSIEIGDVTITIESAENAKRESKRLADSRGGQWNELLARARKL